jgi:glycosyltransferase involved in cell wall biosynthesis
MKAGAETLREGLSTEGVSFVVPTYNNEATLSATLDSIVKQEFEGPRELLLVDDRSTDRTRDVAEQYPFPEEWGFRFVENVSGGLAGGYNCGWNAARYGTLVFMHADCFLPRTDSVVCTLDFFRDPDVVAVMSLTIFPVSEWDSMSFWDQVARGRYAGKESYALGGKFDAMRRDVLVRIGGFDQKHFFCAAEDSDMYLRLKKIGRIARSNVRVVHAHQYPPNAPLRSIFQKQIILGQGFGALLRKHWRDALFYREMKTLLLIHTAKLVMFIGLFFPFTRWVSIAALIAAGFLFSGKALLLRDVRVIWVPAIHVAQMFVFSGAFLWGAVSGRQRIRRSGRA